MSTAAYGIEGGEQNTTEPFLQTCGSGHSVGVGRTAWFSVQGTGGQVTVTTEGSSFDTALFVYSGSPAGGLVTCNDDGAGIGVASSASFSSASGTTYAIQAGSICITPCGGAPSGGTLKILATAAAGPPAPPSPTPSGSSASAPQTSIKSKPPAKTTNHQAKFAFISSASEASFQCSLDGAAFKGCISPRILHTSAGAHIFKVRATAAGLADVTPASYSWKVVRKRRHPAGNSHR